MTALRCPACYGIGTLAWPGRPTLIVPCRYCDGGTNKWWTCATCLRDFDASDERPENEQTAEVDIDNERIAWQCAKCAAPAKAIAQLDDIIALLKLEDPIVGIRKLGLIELVSEVKRNVERSQG